MAHRRFAVTGAALGGTALAAMLLSAPGTPAVAAGAPTVTVDKACYVSAGTTPQKEVVSGSGWTPGDEIQIEDKAILIYTKVTADATGSFTTTVASPVFADTKHVYDTDTLTATDLTAQGNDVTPVPTATSPAFKYTGLDVQAPSGTTHLGSLLKYSFVGFNEGTRVYGHYIFKSKLRANVDFGKVAGPCGLLKAKAKIYPPSSDPAVGNWTVQFDNSPHYSSKSLPQVRYKFQIYRG